MHLEVLVEDQSGGKALKILIPKILQPSNTFRIISYKGIGHLEKNIGKTKGARGRNLLNKLLKLLRGYGKSSAKSPTAVIVVCDLDDKCQKTFRQDLLNLLSYCNPKPETRFCFAIEEGEAWLLGDKKAIKKAYPEAKDKLLQPNANTWEDLADAVYEGGAAALSKKGQVAIGTEKSRWAEKITPHMNIKENSSPSFCHFREKLIELQNLLT